MSSRVAAVVIDAVHPRLVADFWCGVLGWQVVGEEDGVLSIAAADGSSPTIDVAPVPKTKTVRNRLRVVLRFDDLPAADELGRLLDLGARRAEPPGVDGRWAVLCDPEGNEFCVLGQRRG